MIKLPGNNKGMSLVDVIVAMAILGIVSTVITIVYFNAITTSKQSDEQMNINAVISVITLNVTNAVKVPDTEILGNTGAILRLGDGTLTAEIDDLSVLDSSGNVNARFKFDVIHDGSDPIKVDSDPLLLKYHIKLKKADGTVLRQFTLEINTLPHSNIVT